MKISVLQENFSKSLSQVVRFIPSKPQVVEHGLVHLKTGDGKIEMSIKNHATQMMVRCPAKIEKSGEMAISARELLAVVSSFKPGDLRLEKVESSAKLSSAKGKASLQVSEFNFEQQPATQKKELSLKIEELLPLIEWGGLAVGVDEARPAFSSLMLVVEQSTLTAVSTDGFRLSQAVMSLGERTSKNSTESDSTAAPVKVILSHRIIKEVARWLSDYKQGEVGLGVGEEGVVFRIEESELLCRTIDVEYPNYKAIIPTSSELSLTIDIEELAYAMKAVSSLDRVISRQQIVQMCVSEGKVLLKSQSSEVGGIEVELTAQVVWERSEKDFEISFNSQFLSPILSSGVQAVSIGVLEPLKPAIIQQSPEKDGWIYVVMPFRSNK